MFKRIKGLFTNDSFTVQDGSGNEKGLNRKTLYLLQEGIRLSDQRKHKEAVLQFDIVIESGIFKEAYRERGYSLQILGFHLDAIDDFNKAIEFSPNNANNYYGRALSYGSLGFYDKAISDTEIAIGLSQIKSQENDDVNQVAKDKDIMPPTLLYKDYLKELWERKNETNEDIRRIYISPEIRRHEKN